MGLLGGLGGFIFPAIFGYLLHWSGVWSSCWAVLAALALIRLVWMHVVARRVVKQEAPELVQLLERPPRTDQGSSQEPKDAATHLLNAFEKYSVVQRFFEYRSRKHRADWPHLSG